MGIEEGLGKSMAGLDFVVTKVKGDVIITDCFPQKFDRKEYAPFNYKKKGSGIFATFGKTGNL